MENFAANCTAPQDGEQQRLYENLRNWDDEIINQKMEDLGIPNVKLTSKRKYILGMIDSLADIDTKRFFFRNSDFMEIANISKAPFIETIKYFSKLGIIKRVRGVRGTASEYKFNEKNLKKLPLENQTLNTKKNQTLNGVSPSVLGDSNEYGLGKGSGQKQSVENQPPHTQSQSHIQSQLQKQLQSHLQLQEQLHLQLYSQEQMEGLSKILSDNNTRLIEGINTIVQAIVNTKDETIEELKKISTSIDNNSRVKSEVDTKILDKLDKIPTSIDSLPSKSNGEIQPSIDSKVIEEKDKIIEELQDKINKLQTEVNTKDEIIEELQGKLQSSSIENTSKSNGIVQEEVNTKVVEELQGKIDKLQEDYTKVVEERNYFKKRFNDSEEFFKKVKAYIPSEFLGNSKNRKESSSKSNDIVQEEVDTKGLQQEPSKEETPMQEQTPKADTKTASKTTVQEASKPKEAEISKDEEERQLQELKETFKPLLENFKKDMASEERERILNEIGKAYTTKGYSQKVLQPFLDFALTYNFYAEKRDVVESPQQETPSEVSNQTVEEPKQEETVTPSEESRDEDYRNPTFTDEQAQEILSRLPKANSRYEEEEDQEEVIEESEDEVSDDDMKGVVVGDSYPEENDPEF